jgi:AhpC/TSA family
MMIVAIWSVLAALLVLIAAAWFVLLGVVRALDDLQGRLAGSDPYLPREGLAIGSIAPVLRGPTVSGEVFSSDEASGEPMLLVFVHPGCAPCEELVPQIFMVFAAFRLPGTTVLITRGGPQDQPEGWRKSLRANGARLEVVLEREEISEEFKVESRPFAYLVGPDRKIVAARVINNADEVLALVGRDGGAGWSTMDHDHSGTSTREFQPG